MDFHLDVVYCFGIWWNILFPSIPFSYPPAIAGWKLIKGFCRLVKIVLRDNSMYVCVLFGLILIGMLAYMCVEGHVCPHRVHRYSVYLHVCSPIHAYWEAVGTWTHPLVLVWHSFRRRCMPLNANLAQQQTLHPNRHERGYLHRDAWKTYASHVGKNCPWQECVLKREVWTFFFCTFILTYVDAALVRCCCQSAASC